MPKEAHTKAAEHTKTREEQKGSITVKAITRRLGEELTKARGHSKTAHEHSEIAHNKSQSQK